MTRTLMMAVLSVCLLSRASFADGCVNQGENARYFGIGAGIDLGFRMRGGKCVNSSGEQGLNPNCIGPCGDLRGVEYPMPLLPLANLQGADLSNGIFREVDFRRTSLLQAKLQGTDLEGSSFYGALLDLADFTGASLRHAMLGGASAKKAVFRGADLREVWWNVTHAQGADFRDADLTSPWAFDDLLECFPGSCLRGAIYNRGTRLPREEHVMIHRYGMQYQE